AGKRVLGEECFKLGLTNKLVESNEIIDVAKSWAIELSKKPTIGIGITKQDMIFSLNNDLLSTIEFEAKEQVAAFYSEDLKEGVTAFLEKRKANFKGK
ncbi:enoyl-CoA hydratase-related protein, partial [Flavobacteriaceae bacterium]|nr:enoyl-CoA hydratase-related protein [Flavobacteriaceae bacterium]